jgi:catechol 2,3-dioxygenase-like lactoylglutathione lyase family enzyme
MAITRLNHAVLLVRDVDAAAAFYASAFGFVEIDRPRGMRAVFLRTADGENHHDLGLFEVGPQAARPSRGRLACTISPGRWTRSRDLPRWQTRSEGSAR